MLIGTGLERDGAVTLVVGAVTDDYAIQVSDRRLTWEDGSVADDESNKLFVFDSDYCRFLVGYSGLAHVTGTDGFKTSDWLTSALRDAAPPDFDPVEILERLRLAASRQFSMPNVQGLKPSVRRLTIMLTGFLTTTNGTTPAFAMLTNFQDFERGDDDEEVSDDFRSWSVVLKDPMRMSVERIGAWRQFRQQEADALIALMMNRRPAKAVIGKTVELIREIAGPPGSPSTVGRQLMSAVISAERDGLAESFYHSDVEKMSAHVPNLILARSEVIATVRNVVIRTGGTAPLIFPPQARNQRCACRSGKKYKRCHGRQL